MPLLLCLTPDDVIDVIVDTVDTVDTADVAAVSVAAAVAAVGVVAAAAAPAAVAVAASDVRIRASCCVMFDRQVSFFATSVTFSASFSTFCTILFFFNFTRLFTVGFLSFPVLVFCCLLFCIQQFIFRCHCR